MRSGGPRWRALAQRRRPRRRGSAAPSPPLPHHPPCPLCDRVCLPHRQRRGARRDRRGRGDGRDRRLRDRRGRGAARGAGPARARVSSVRAWSGPGAPGDIMPDGWRAPLRTPRAAIHRSPASSHRRTRRRPYLVQGPTARRSRWQPPCARQGPAPSAPAGCCARPMRARPVCPRRRPAPFAREPRTHSATGARRR